jgi:hypothetical protein
MEKDKDTKQVKPVLVELNKQRNNQRSCDVLMLTLLMN